MSEWDIDWNALRETAASGFDPVPIGQYECTVDKSEAVKTQNGKPMIKVQFKVQTGPHANRVIFNNFVVSPESPNAMGFFFRHMAALGLDANYFAQRPSMQNISDALLGRSVVVGVKIRQYQGADQNEVTSIKPWTGGGVGAPGVPQPMAPAPGVPAGFSPPPVAPQALATPQAPVAPPVAPVAPPVAPVPTPAPAPPVPQYDPTVTPAGQIAAQVVAANSATEATPTPAPSPAPQTGAAPGSPF